MAFENDVTRPTLCHVYGANLSSVWLRRVAESAWTVSSGDKYCFVKLTRGKRFPTTRSRVSKCDNGAYWLDDKLREALVKTGDKIVVRVPHSRHCRSISRQSRLALALSGGLEFQTDRIELRVCLQLYTVKWNFMFTRKWICKGWIILLSLTLDAATKRFTNHMPLLYTCHNTIWCWVCIRPVVTLYDWRQDVKFWLLTCNYIFVP